MSKPMLSYCLALIALPVLLFASNLPAHAQGNRQWVGTWAASPMLAPMGSNRGHFDATFREIVHISNGGSQIRIRFTNEFGIDGLTIGSGKFDRWCTARFCDRFD